MSTRRMLDEAFGMLSAAFDKVGSAINVMASENWNGEDGVMFAHSDSAGNVQVKGKIKTLRVNGYLVRLPDHVMEPRKRRAKP